jgi:hypothetical protein
VRARGTQGLAIGVPKSLRRFTEIRFLSRRLLEGDTVRYMGRSEKIDSGASGEAVLGEMIPLQLLSIKMTGKKGVVHPTERGHFRFALKGTYCLCLNS